MNLWISFELLDTQATKRHCHRHSGYTRGRGQTTSHNSQRHPFIPNGSSSVSVSVPSSPGCPSCLFLKPRHVFSFKVFSCNQPDQALQQKGEREAQWMNERTWHNPNSHHGTANDGCQRRGIAAKKPCQCSKAASS
ncbi:hypothetical protein ACLKA7_003368 [Drosophila subpalustris]